MAIMDSQFKNEELHVLYRTSNMNCIFNLKSWCDNISLYICQSNRFFMKNLCCFIFKLFGAVGCYTSYKSFLDYFLWAWFELDIVLIPFGMKSLKGFILNFMLLLFPFCWEHILLCTLKTGRIWHKLNQL